MTDENRFRGNVMTVHGAYRTDGGPGENLGTHVVSLEGHRENREANSHTEFFREGRQKMRRMAALEELVTRTATIPGFTSVKTKTISDDAWLELQQHPECWEEEGFQPLSMYAHKIVRADGKVLRPILPGEVGTIDKDGEIVYLVLEEGFTPGVRVGADITSKGE